MNTKQELYWKVIESFKWDSAGNYDKEMLNFWTKDVLKETSEYTRNLRLYLQEILCQHAEKVTGKRYNYYGVSDDGFWDLASHIVGLGQNVYHLVLKYPEIAKMMADESDYMENFEYIFSDFELK